MWARLPEVAERLEAETKPGAKLPEHVGKTMAKKKAKKKTAKKARAKKAPAAKKARAKKARAKKAHAKKKAHAREATKLERQALVLLKKALVHKKHARSSAY